MAVTLKVELTDLEYAALAHIAVDPHDWFQDMVKLRCRNTISEIAENKIKELIADPKVDTIPANKELLFSNLVSDGTIKTAKYIMDNEQVAGEMKFMPSTANDLTPQ
jgi:hypothetical protein